MTLTQTTPDQSAADTAQTAVMLTCSIAQDADLFGLLARSIDDHVSDDIKHRVIVPSADLPAFRQYATARRTIIAQEDVLPVRLWKLPAALRHLSFVKAGFRRPLYLTSDRHLIRGWMLQQLLKIQLSAESDCTAIMHVDSDVCFVRDIQSADLFHAGAVRFFRAMGRTRNPMHQPWINASSRFLGINPPKDYHAHYIENCVVWRTDLVRSMIAHIEDAKQTSFHTALFGASTISEYYLCGIYADLLAHDKGLHPEDTSFCNSYWPDSETDPVDFERLRNRLDPKHCAISVQSTHKIDIEDRAALYNRAQTEFSKA